MYTPNALMRARQALAAATIATVMATTVNAGIPIASAAEQPAQRQIVSTAVALVDYESTSNSNTSIGVADSTLYNLSQDELVERLNAMKSLGVTDLRVGVPWVYIQPTRDTYDWSKMDNVIDTASSLGFSITGDITGNPAWDGTVLAGAPNPTAYANFASAVASRYGTKIGSYEIWNEPNGVVFFAPVSAAKYTEVLKAAYTAIKAANPDAIVVAGALGAAGNIKGVSQTASDFLTAMYAAGAKGYFDALSYHPYGTTLPFSSGADVNNAALQQIQALYATMVANGDGGLKIWGTEYGNATVPVIGVTETEQAQFLQDFVTAWTRLSFTGPAFVYTAQDIHTGLLNAEANYGLYNSDGTPKQAALVLAKLIADLAANGSLPDYTAPKLSQARDAYLQLTSLGFGLVNTGLIIPNAIIEAAYQQMPTAGKKAFTAIANYVSARFVSMVAAMAPLTQAALGAMLNIGPAMKDPQKALSAAAVRFQRDLQHTEDSVAAALAGTRATLASLAQPHTTKAVSTTSQAAITAAPDPATDNDKASDTAATASSEQAEAKAGDSNETASKTAVAGATSTTSAEADAASAKPETSGGRHRKDDADTTADTISSRATTSTSKGSTSSESGTNAGSTTPAKNSDGQPNTAASSDGGAAKPSNGPRHARPAHSTKKPATSAQHSVAAGSNEGTNSSADSAAKQANNGGGTHRAKTTEGQQ